MKWIRLQRKNPSQHRPSRNRLLNRPHRWCRWPLPHHLLPQSKRIY